MNDIQAPASDAPFHDARAAHDLAGLRFDTPLGASARQWALVRIAPEPHSGASTTANAMIESETGRLIDVQTLQPIAPERAQTRIIKEGTWQVVGDLGQTPRAGSGRYSWLEKPRIRIRSMTPEDVYSPFEKGGVILCGLDLSAEGHAKFDPVCLIPAGWETHVRAGMEQLSTQEWASDSETARRLIASANPIVAIFAFREFIPSVKEEQNWVDAVVRVGDGREAALTYIILGIRNDPAEKWRRWLERTADQSWRALAAGALAAAMLADASSGTQARAHRLLEALREKPRAASDPYVVEVLRVFDLG